MIYEKITYPDGTFYPRVLDFSMPNIVTERINNYDDLWFVKQLKDVLDSNGTVSSLFIPCLIDGQADRRFKKNESANLKLTLKFINDMKFNKVTVFHPHNAEMVEAMVDNCIIKDNSDFIKDVWKDIASQEGYNLDNLIMMSPDAGAYKWITKLADNISFTGEVYGAGKSRKFEGGVSTLTQSVDREDFGGKDILLVDDICVYGGSAIGLANLLRTKNVGKLYFAASHMTVKNPRPELFELYDKVFTTNSKYETYDYPESDKFMIWKLPELL